MVGPEMVWVNRTLGEFNAYMQDYNSSSTVVFNFCIGAAISLFMTLLSSLGVVLQAAALDEQRQSNENNLITVEGDPAFDDENDEDDCEDYYENDPHFADYADGNNNGSYSDTTGVGAAVPQNARQKLVQYGTPVDGPELQRRLKDVSVTSASPAGDDTGLCIQQASDSQQDLDVADRGSDLDQSVIDIDGFAPHDSNGRRSLVESIAAIISRFDHTHTFEELIERTERSLWYVGFSMYITSQLVGGFAALSFISPVVIAPLGSFGLIFNVVLSHLLLGAKITGRDWFGTLLVVIGCATISTFASCQPEIRDGPKIDDFYKYLMRSTFQWYFGCQLLVVILLFSLGKYLEYGPMIFKIHKESSLIPEYDEHNEGDTSETAEIDEEYSDEERPLVPGSRKHSIYANDIPLQFVLSHRKTQLLGGIFATCGGIVASETLLMTKAGIEIVVGAFFESAQHTVGFRFMIGFIILLVGTAVLQLYSLNRALRYAMPTVVIPTFYTFFTVLSLFNMLVFMDQFSEYATPDIAALSIGLISLISGVYLLSGKEPEHEKMITKESI